MTANENQAVTGTENSSEASATDVNETLAVTQETVTYAVYRASAKEGQDISKIPFGFGILKEGNDLHKSVYGYKDAKGNDVAPDTDLLRTVTVTEPIVHNIDGVSQVIKDPEEAALIYMQGQRQNLKSQLKAKLTALDENTGDFEYQGESLTYDEVLDILNTPKQRRNLSETQKAMKLVNSLSDEAKQAVLKALGYV